MNSRQFHRQFHGQFHARGFGQEFDKFVQENSKLLLDANISETYDDTQRTLEVRLPDMGNISAQLGKIVNLLATTTALKDLVQISIGSDYFSITSKHVENKPGTTLSVKEQVPVVKNFLNDLQRIRDREKYEQDFRKEVTSVLDDKADIRSSVSGIVNEYLFKK